MTTGRNWRNGTGNSIDKVEWPTETTTYTDDTRPRGFVSKADGLVKVTLASMDTPTTLFTVAGAHMMYDVTTIHDDGAVAITDIMMFW